MSRRWMLAIVVTGVFIGLNSPKTQAQARMDPVDRVIRECLNEITHVVQQTNRQNAKRVEVAKAFIENQRGKRDARARIRRKISQTCRQIRHHAAVRAKGIREICESCLIELDEMGADEETIETFIRQCRRAVNNIRETAEELCDELTPDRDRPDGPPPTDEP